MTTSIENYGCLSVGMQAHLLEKVVRDVEHVRLTVPQLEFVDNISKTCALGRRLCGKQPKNINPIWNTYSILT